jgi:hypothetical protein
VIGYVRTLVPCSSEPSASTGASSTSCRATEAHRYAERDRAVAELRRRAEPKEKRTLVGMAYWRCT